MKVGLIRHFKVKKGLPEKHFLTTDELIQWFNEYDTFDIEDGETDLCGIDWKRCLTSDLSRAAKTAEKIYSGKIIKMEELREIPLPIFKTNIKLPFLLWAVLIKLSWLINHKTRFDISEAKKRVEVILDKILHSEEDILIVSHAALMKYMKKELLRRNFKGPKFKTPANGKLYIFER